MEAPSPRRLERARREGREPVSHRLAGAASLAAVVVALGPCAEALCEAFARGLSRAVTASSGEPVALVDAARTSLGDVARASWLALLGAAVAYGLAVAAQTRGLVAWGAREGDAASWRDALAARLWALGVGVAGGIAAWSLARDAGLGARTAAEVGARGASLVEGVAWRVVAAAAVAGAAELAWRWRAHLRAMRPTREEAARERREDEGAPELRAAVARERDELQREAGR